MCGIGGIVGWRGARDELQAACHRIAVRLNHRGPDDRGLFLDANGTTGLVHARLSIIDLSSAGHQPMSTRDGRFTITFNGEIYNYQALRLELESEGVVFQSHSDTEVLLQLFEHEGVACIRRLIGMYAFAVWDREAKSLSLVRGPLGIKPIYYWHVGSQLAFASEVRSLLEAELGPRELCESALFDYFVHGSPQEPSTLIAGVKMLEPGHHLIWKNGAIEVNRAWSFEFPEVDMSEQDAIDLTRTALQESIQRHFVSDVPVGVFLSGGLDSTAILALAKDVGIRDLHTFSISFEESAYDEGEVAARTAKHFGAQHHSMRLTAQDALKLLPEYAEALDQPSIDGFNVYCVSKLAREHGLKVVLSGLGGDELFGSYPSFTLIPMLLRWYQRFGNQASIRSWIGRAISILPSNHRAERFGRFLRSGGTTLDAYHAVRGIFSPTRADRLVRYYSSDRSNNQELDPSTTIIASTSLGDQISLLEMTHYMLNQLLRDADVMSMAHGLELRVPFVDVALLKAVSQIPSAIRLQQGKRLLIEAVPEIPEWVRNQPKRGFAFPFETWFRQQWSREFARINLESPVPLSRWYHQWAVYSFERFLEACKVEREGRSQCRSS